MSAGPTEVVACPIEWREHAFLLLAGSAHSHAMPVPARPEIEADGRDDNDQLRLWVGHRGGRIIGVLLAQHLAGGIAALWPPRVIVKWGRTPLAQRLIKTALGSLCREGARLVQALLGPTASREAQLHLVRAGIPHVTDLLCLGRSTTQPIRILTPTPRLHWEAYSECNAAAFRSALAATYEASLDMPELEGMRGLDEVLASQRRSGQFNPTLWQLGRLDANSEAVAVLLLADQPERDTLEVAYLGVTPPWRRRGLGRAALGHALELARPSRERIELAVDVRNQPALRLYRTSGFIPLERRAVHLCSLQAHIEAQPSKFMKPSA